MNVGLALMTTRGLRTVAFMTGSDLRASLLDEMGRAVLACGGVLDARKVADDLIGGTCRRALGRGRGPQESYS